MIHGGELIRILELERFAIHDGPGIRTVVFLQGCPLRCPWCANPESWELMDNAPAVKGASRLSGMSMTAGAIMTVLLRDRDYYEASGGGITFSGGEPFVQFEALRTLLERCRKEGLNTAVETSGQTAADLLAEAAPLVNRFLLDIKTADPEKLEKVCGGNRTVFENIAWIGAHQDSGFLVTGRVPVIPGFNSDGESMTAIFALAKRHGIVNIDLLPYHTLGKGKYKELGLEYRGPEGKMMSREELLPLAETGRAMGLEIHV